ncbi:PAS domain-containing protein [Trabulsiella odontotermitis]|uniref:PAS domain-containing protein n=1 Tax=Trabulsiella odontotermitis TaxID=379893 RepID=UPI000676682B|nr:PAS domain-containing protein [Trabulsiella odontotermitis]
MLAQLMPGLSTHQPLRPLLFTINASLGACLTWTMIDDGKAPRLEVAGDLACNHQHVARLLAHIRREPERNWRIRYWRHQAGRLLYPESHPDAGIIQSAALCKIPLQGASHRNYLFVAFPHSLTPSSVIKSIAIILAEKLKGYLSEVILKERTASELNAIMVKYQLMLDCAPILLNSFDASRRCILWNRACERSFGWTQNDINHYTDPLALFYPNPEMRELVRLSFSPFNDTPVTEMHTRYPVRRDGATLTTLWSNITMSDGAILNIGVDVTGLKKSANRRM